MYPYIYTPASLGAICTKKVGVFPTIFYSRYKRSKKAFLRHSVLHPYIYPSVVLGAICIKNVGAFLTK